MCVTFTAFMTSMTIPELAAAGGVTVNLNQYRKRRRRAEAERRATDNRVRFKRSKEEGSKPLRGSVRARNELEGKRLDSCRRRQNQQQALNAP